MKGKIILSIFITVLMISSVFAGAVTVIVNIDTNNLIKTKTVEGKRNIINRDNIIPASFDYWSIETVDSSGNVGLDTSIALDSSGKPHIGYYDSTNHDLKYAKKTGSSWDLETVDGDFGTDSDTSIALDSNNRPHISYGDETNSDLKYAKKTGSSWDLETVDSDGNVWDTSIALDSGSTPHIGYYDWSNLDLKYATKVGCAMIP